MARALIPLANGFEEIEAVSVIDILRRGGVEVVTASITDSTEVQGAHGITVKADALFSAVGEEPYEAIVLPGGGVGTEHLGNCDALIRRIQRHHDEGGLLAAICAAPTVLVEAGVLEPGVQVTCYPTCQMQLDRPWANVPVVADQGVITGQAPGSAMLFGLVLVQELVSEAMMNRVAREMVTDVLA